MAQPLSADDILKAKSRVTYIGALINIVLTLVKIIIGFIGQSTSLIADGIHSFSDLVSDLLVLIAIKLGSREADHSHPYGHRRFETIATVMLGIGLILVAGGIAWDAGDRLLHPEKLLIPTKDTLAIALFSILANEGLYHYTRYIGKKTRSKLLMANAWHHRSDALSSVVVLIGITAVLYGYPNADAIAAIIVTLMITKMGIYLILESIKELVDSSLPEEFVRDIKKTIKQTGGVQSIHLLRTRQMGEDAYIDAHIVVDPRISVSEGHMIGDAVRDNIKSTFQDVADVLVHVDPEDDEFKDENNKPLNRKQIQTFLDQYFADHIHSIEDFRIHYLDGLIEIEVILPHGLFNNPEHLDWIKTQCAKLENDVQMIDKAYVFFKV